MYPFLYPFGTKSDCLRFVTESFNWSGKELETAERLVAKGMIPLNTGTEMAVYLGVSKKLIGAMAINPNRYYTKFQIPKASGDMRTINAPRVFLKTIQRYILDCILNQIIPHEAACGFRLESNCSKGAKRHLNRAYLWNIDLENYFPSILKRSVLSAFVQNGYPDGAASILSSLCCLDGTLPQGAPTSPSLANLIFASTDAKIDDIAKADNIVYTRYADDLSFSAHEPIPKEFREAIIQIVNASGFKINEKKTRLMGPKCCRQVTGLTVNEKVSIPRERRRKLRAQFFQIQKDPALYTSKKNKLLGVASWVMEYHPVEGKKYFEITRSIPDSPKSGD